MDYVRTPDERFTNLPDFSCSPHYLDLECGLRMHHIDAGPADGPVVLLLHGQPTWSYLYRRMIPVLEAGGCRVIAPDLIGFGRSDKPTQRTAHSVRAHIGWLMECIEQLALNHITMVVQDWGGAFGLGALARMPERFARVVATNTTLHTTNPDLAGRLGWACHRADDGTMVIEQALLDYQRMTQELAPLKPSLFVAGATQKQLTEAELAAYDAPFPHETYCAGPRQLPLLMALTPNSECARTNSRTLASLREFPGTLLTAYSDGDAPTKGWDLILQGTCPGAANQPHTTLSGGHYVQEDAGPELARLVVEVMQADQSA